MKVGVGSQNKTKVGAVEIVLADYPMFSEAEVIGVAVVVEEFGHPKSIEETVDGAISRATQAYEGNDYGFGIEGGLLAVPKTKSGFMEIAICAIYDGKQIHLGLSPGLEWPTKAIEGILMKGYDGSQAMKASGFTDQEKVGTTGGVFDFLTRGRVTRTEQNALAVKMALVHLENPEHF